MATPLPPRHAVPHPRARALPLFLSQCFALAVTLAWTAGAAQAQQAGASRERAQLQQLQQQIQRLQEDNARLQQERARDQARLATLESKSESETQAARREAERLRSSQGLSQRETRRLGDELQAARSSLTQAETALAQAQAQAQAELERLRAEITQRDTALQQAGAQLGTAQREAEQERNVLVARSRLNVQRAQACEAKHAQAHELARSLVDRWEERQLRACEPFTGLWRVKEETRVQDLRDQLFEARLDVPAPDTTAAPNPAPR